MKFRKLLLLICCLTLISYTLYGQDLRNEVIATYKGKSISLENALSLYVQFNSISGNEKEAGEWLKDFCLENGLFVTQMGNQNGNYNFTASLYPLSKQLPNIIFLNHIDVVPVGDQDSWTCPPFSGKIINNEIWGRGAFDNKGNAVMQLFAILQIKQNLQNELPYNITLLAVSGEETQSDGGVKYVIDNYFNDLNAEVVLGEGPPGIVDLLNNNTKTTTFCVSLAHKRAFWLQLDLNIETSGHGSITPLQYANKEMNTALYKLLKKKQKAIYTNLNIDVLKQLGNLEGGFKGWILKHPKLFKPVIVPQLRKQPELFSLFSNTITFTGINSDVEAVNVIPSKVTAYLDCRLLPLESSEDFMADLKKKLNNEAITITVLEEMPKVEISSATTNYYKSIVNAIKLEYGITDDVIAMFSPNFNDLGVFRSKGVQCYGFIPIIFERDYLELIHNINERIPVSVLEKGKNTYVNFLNNLLK
jgi:acetylornithine deacetylase/succinyl-diaminopimelate desuccinylase-like protein